MMAVPPAPRAAAIARSAAAGGRLGGGRGRGLRLLLRFLRLLRFHGLSGCSATPHVHGRAEHPGNAGAVRGSTGARRCGGVCEFDSESALAGGPPRQNCAGGRSLNTRNGRPQATGWSRGLPEIARSHRCLGARRAGAFVASRRGRRALSPAAQPCDRARAAPRHRSGSPVPRPRHGARRRITKRLSHSPEEARRTARRRAPRVDPAASPARRPGSDDDRRRCGASRTVSAEKRLRHARYPDRGTGEPISETRQDNYDHVA